MLRALGATLAALTLAACATLPPERPGPRPAEPGPPIALRALPGWAQDDHRAAYDAFRQGCGASHDPGIARICREARAAGALDRDQAGAFFETRFQAEALPGEGVLTGYFAPEYPARHSPDAEFSAPVRPRPADAALLTADRATIEAQAGADALAWLRPEDLFFLQVQGSGVLAFADGTRMKALYATTNGRPFVAIANPMRQMALLPASDTSAEAIHAWLAAHRGPEARAIMDLNPRYAFFRLAPDDGRPPAGAAGIALPPGRALAVDPAWHAMGQPLWIDGEAPTLAGARPTYRRLAVALDTGGAIKGPDRADLYIGQGAAAGAEAGRIRHTLRLYRLVPR
jgi:membrane-bound lytic murein transglycosylase A